MAAQPRSSGDAHAPVGGALHGRRVGRPLRAQQRERVARTLPAIAINLAALDAPARIFAQPVEEIRMEIGFGAGEHLAYEAGRQPEIGFIGCEPFRNGVAKMVERVEAQALGNVRLHCGDASLILDRLPDAALAQVDILYPDPWPKRRQRKRRFLSDHSLAALGRVMRSGAELRFATDIDDYAAWVLARVLRSDRFTWAAEDAGAWRSAWQPWSSTRYEAKALQEGRKPVYLTFVRV